MKNPKLYQEYSHNIQQLAQTIALHSQKGKWYVFGEIVFFILLLGCIAAFTILENASWCLLGAILSLATYVWIRKKDVRNDQRIQHYKSLKLMYEKECNYLKNNFSHFDTGKAYIEPSHRFTYDLDIFGQNSLFQRINRTISSGGADYLAASLSGKWQDKDYTTLLSKIQQRAEAIEELSENISFLSHFKSLGTPERIQTQEIKEAFQRIYAYTIPQWFSTKFVKGFIYIYLIGFALSILLAILNLIPSTIPSLWGLSNLILSVGLSNKHIKNINSFISSLNYQVSGYMKMMSLIDQQTLRSPQLDQLKEQLQGAEQSFTQLNKILQKIDNRSNEIGIIIFNTFGLLDIFIVRSFAQWQNGNKQKSNQWIDAANTFDALVSMANFCINEDKIYRAELLNQKEICYRAENIYHPFLGEKAVKNNFDIAHLSYYIITGANMAGKSTFLRTLGINYVLAMNGMPVFADRMQISIFRLFTNMRTTDDLAKGISYFNAELIRLQQLITSLDNETPSLIILDEILKGTNSLDKLNGSQLFLRYIARKNVSGVIATHDLELSKLSDEQPDTFHNYCFEIELGEKVTYSYKITQGVAANQNATFLLKNILK